MAFGISLVLRSLHYALYMALLTFHEFPVAFRSFANSSDILYCWRCILPVCVGEANWIRPQRWEREWTEMLCWEVNGPSSAKDVLRRSQKVCGQVVSVSGWVGRQPRPDRQNISHSVPEAFMLSLVYHTIFLSPPHASAWPRFPSGILCAWYHTQEGFPPGRDGALRIPVGSVRAEGCLVLQGFGHVLTRVSTVFKD